MKELRNGQVVDAQFEEVTPGVVAHEMGEEEGPTETVEVKAQVVISLMETGELDVSIPEGFPELKAIEIEGLTRQVYEQLRDIRVATTAIEIFKQRLG
jgi:hypothetical protein